MTPITISDRLFSKVGRYFGGPEDAIQEAVQNAYRSYWPISPESKPVIGVSVMYRGDTMDVTIHDFGRGIDDPGQMLSLASSDWASDVEGDQDPAGLGVCALLAFASSTTWSSRFGTITVEGKRFFSEAQYRADLVDRVGADSLTQGTSVTMAGMPVIARSRLLGMLSMYTLVEVKLTTVAIVDGTPETTSETVEPKWKTPVIENDRFRIYIADDYCAPIESFLWHGHTIAVEGASYLAMPTVTIGDVPVQLSHPGSSYLKGAHVIIEPKFERAITPKLPDRKNVIMDAKTAATREEAMRLLSSEVYDRAVEAIDEGNLQLTFESPEAPTKPTLLSDDTWKLLKAKLYKGRIVQTAHAEEHNRELRRRRKVVRRVDVSGYLDGVITVYPKGIEAVEHDPEGVLLNDNSRSCPLLDVGCAFHVKNETGLTRYRLVVKAEKTKQLGRSYISSFKSAVLIPDGVEVENAFRSKLAIAVPGLESMSAGDAFWGSDRGAHVHVVSNQVAGTMDSDEEMTLELEQDNDGSDWRKEVFEGYNLTRSKMNGRVSLGSAYKDIRSAVRYKLMAKDQSKIKFDFDKGRVHYDGKWHNIEEST